MAHKLQNDMLSSFMSLNYCTDDRQTDRPTDINFIQMKSSPEGEKEENEGNGNKNKIMAKEKHENLLK